MEKNHFYFLEILLIVVISLLSFLVITDRRNSESIKEVSNEVRQLSEAISKSVTEESVIVHDYSTESLADVEINASEPDSHSFSLGDYGIEQIDDLKDIFHASMDKILGNQELLAKDLKQNVLGLSEQMQIISKYINQTADGNAIATESFNYASDDTKPYEERKYYFLNAIMHNPADTQYYNEYILFLDRNNAVPEEYWTLAAILDSAMAQMNPDLIEVLLPIYKKITSEIIVNKSEKNEDAVDTFSIWHDSAESFLETVKSGQFESNEMQSLYEEALYAFEALEEFTPEDQKQYELINQLYSLYSSYFRLCDLHDRVIEMDADTFISSYSLVNQNMESGKSAFLIASLGEEYKVTIDKTYKEILNISEKVNELYDLYRAMKIFKSIESLATELTSDVSSSLSNSDLESIIERYGEVKIEYSTYLSTITSQSSLSYVTVMQELLSKVQKDIYTAQFTEYQLWASEILSNASKVKDVYRKEDRLEALYDLGYFEINPSLLIPQLSTVYNAIDWADMKDKSIYTVDQLIKKYNPVIKGIGDV